MEIIFYCILLIYVILIVILIFGISKVDYFNPNNEAEKIINHFTILIPFRNEVNNLPDLLHSIIKIDYPKENYHIIFINDDSHDQSTNCIESILHQYPSINYQVIDRIATTNSAKKDAITQAIAQSTTEWIVTTDADCTLPYKWLKTLNQIINKKDPKMVIGSVVFPKTKGLLNLFQYYDLISLQGVTIGSFGMNQPFMCNGANLAYTKTLFNTLEGFTSIENIVSGDDVFLLQKALKKHKKEIYYLLSNDHKVSTKTESSWKKLFNQRVRWAAKTNNYITTTPKIIGLIVLITNLCLCIAPLSLNVGLTIQIYAIKFSIDLLFIIMSSKKLSQNYRIAEIIQQSIIYPLFSTIVATYSIFGSFSWKGRINDK